MRKKRHAGVLEVAVLVIMLSGCTAPSGQERTSPGQEAASSGQEAAPFGQETAPDKDQAGEETSGQAEGPPKEITSVLDQTPNTSHTGIYVAEEKGYFKDAGLEVSIVQPPENGAEVLAVSGKAQFAISFQDSLAPAFSGDTWLPVTAVAAVIQHNTSGIISHKGEGTDRPKGLESVKYVTWDLPIEKTTIQDVMEVNGDDFSKVQLIPSMVTDEVTVLKTRLVDAIRIFYAWAGIKTEIEGLETDYFTSADLNPIFDFYTPVIIANNDFLEQEPDMVRASVEAVSKGYQDAVKEPKEAADILCKAVPELDPEFIKASQIYLADQYQADAERWGYISPDRRNGYYSWLNEKGPVETPIEEDTGLSNDYLPWHVRGDPAERLLRRRPEMRPWSKEEQVVQLKVEGVSKSFDGEPVIQDISIELSKGELVSLLGISGEGKTILSNIIAGLSTPDKGRVLMEGEGITGCPGRVSYMLRKDLLFPSRTIEDNAALPLIIRGMKRKRAKQEAGGYFAQFGLEGTQKKYPAQLSGGMRQRAALLRTYLFSGSVALLDEPFSALDMLTKQSVHSRYLNVLEQIRLSTLSTTHDIDEAVLLSDRIYLLTGKSDRITGEIVVREPKPRSGDFHVMEAFLEYKKCILNHLKEHSEAAL